MKPLNTIVWKSDFILPNVTRYVVKKQHYQIYKLGLYEIIKNILDEVKSGGKQTGWEGNDSSLQRGVLNSSWGHEEKQI